MYAEDHKLFVNQRGQYTGWFENLNENNRRTINTVIQSTYPVFIHFH